MENTRNLIETIVSHPLAPAIINKLKDAIDTRVAMQEAARAMIAEADCVTAKLRTVK